MDGPQKPESGPPQPAAPREPLPPSAKAMSGCAKGVLWTLAGAITLLVLVFIFILAVCSRR